MKKIFSVVDGIGLPAAGEMQPPCARAHGGVFI